MVHGDISRIAIGYKYNYQKVLYFFTTEVSGRTKSYITYLSKYHYQFANVVIQPVVFPQIISKFFGYVNEIDHQKIQTFRFSFRKVLDYSVWLATYMYYSFKRNYHYKWLENIFLWD